MSLINDALKRAKQARAFPSPDPMAAPLHPAETPPRPPFWVWLWCGLALLVAAVLASWAIFIGFLADRDVKLSEPQFVRARETARTSNRPPVSLPVVKAQPIHEPELESALTPTAPSAKTPKPKAVPKPPEPKAVTASTTVTSTNPPAPASNLAAVVEPPKPAVPVIKLQGIFYKPDNPVAMINSKMVQRGDKVLDARVLAISRNSVTLEQNGKTVVLTLTSP